MTDSHPSPAATPAGPLPLALNAQLSGMMFLQYAIWGAWLPLLYKYLSDHLHFSGNQIGAVFAVGGIGAIVAPFIAGNLADRYFATQKFLGVSHLIGGGLMWVLGSLTDFWQFVIFSLVYSLVYSPTLSLTNSLAFHHLPDRNRDFGRIRVWGTLGWIAVGITVAQWLLRHYALDPGATMVKDAARAAGFSDLSNLTDLKALQDAVRTAGIADAFRLAGILGIAMGLFCFVLPNTPPSPGKEKNASLEALGEVRRNPLLTLFVLAVPISCIHQFYFVQAAAFVGKYQGGAEGFVKFTDQVFGAAGGGLMTIGQMSELCVLALMPFLARLLSRKTLLAAGIIAYGLRMCLFAYVENISAATHIPSIAIVMAAIALHGLCFGCFVFVAYMVVDEETTGDVRASAQSLFNLVIVGIGIIVGSYIATSVVPAWAMRKVGDQNVMDYTRLFSVPMWASVACLAVLLVCYPRKKPA